MIVLHSRWALRSTYNHEKLKKPSDLDDQGSLILTLLILAEEGVDRVHDTSRGDNDVVEQLVQLLVVADGNHDVTRNNTDTLVVARSVTSQLEDFGGQVLQNGSEVNGSSNTNTASILALLKLTVQTTDGEGQTGLVGAGLLSTGLGLGGGSGSLLGCHFENY